MAKSNTKQDRLEAVALAAVIIAIIVAAVVLIINGDGVWVLWFGIFCSLVFF